MLLTWLWTVNVLMPSDSAIRAAVSFVHANAAQYRAVPDRLILCGRSAGGVEQYPPRARGARREHEIDAAGGHCVARHARVLRGVVLGEGDPSRRLDVGDPQRSVVATAS
jgi:hypothetical protein